MNMNRREFFGLTAAAGAFSLAGCKTGSTPGIAAGRSANGRLRLAVIGSGSIAKGSDIPGFASHKRVEMCAFCDVDLKQMEPLRARFPKANYYQNWRELLDKESPDAVLVATPDHNHCLIMSEVLKRGIHLYAQKPLCRSFAENRQLESLAASSGVVTQLGAQITAWECDRHTVEIIRQGWIGEIEKVWEFSNSGYYAVMLPRKWPLETSPVPDTLDWKGWLEGAPYRDWVAGKVYTHINWRCFRDFGSGWLGDMGSHLMLPVWMGMDLGKTVPLSAKASIFDCGWSEEMKRQYLPLYTHVTWQFPGVKASGMKPFEVEWCDGPRGGGVPKEYLLDEDKGKAGTASATKVPAEFMPPEAFMELGRESALGELPIQGRVVKGTDGWLISTHYNQPPVMLDKNGKRRPIKLPYIEPVGSHYHEFIDCCLDGGRCTTDLSWTTKLTDWLLLGRKAIDNPGKEVKIG